MKRSKKALYIKNVLMVLVCICLAVCFVGFLAWDSKSDRIKGETLLQEVKKSNEKTKKEDKEVREEEKQEIEPEQVVGISFWGDEFFRTEEEIQYSARVKLEEKLQAEGYQLEYVDKTLTGASTLSVMKMAGVPQTDLDNYIEEHKANAGGRQLPVTEVGIRDLTSEQMERIDKDFIPVITMGYYGGWNKDPKELAEQQQKVLDTFGKNKDKFIIVGVRPMDGTVDIEEYEQVMKETWGQHYVSAIDVCTVTTTTMEGQRQVADAVYDKMIELQYIMK